MNGVAIPVVSAGSNEMGAREMWMAHVICPSGAAPAGAATRSTTSAARRERARSLPILLWRSLPLEPHVLQRSRPRIRVDQHQPRLGDARADAAHPDE